MECCAAILRALAIRGKFADYEIRTYGREWTTEELTLGLMKDIGDLAMLVQASQGVRQVPDLDKALGHELPLTIRAFSASFPPLANRGTEAMRAIGQWEGDCMLVPGLVRTAEYARAVFDAWLPVSGHGIPTPT
jgi:hypothetical protein